MLFNSLAFTIFLPVVFLLYWLVPARWRNTLLLIASYYFYFSYNPWFVLLLFGTSAFDYYCARQIGKRQDPRQRKVWLTLSVFSNLAVLFCFKYFVFCYNSLAMLWQLGGHADLQLLQTIIIPAGLSFYTFQSLSYTIDVYRRQYPASDTFQDFLLYVSFFPHMVAGPVVRYNSLMPQLKLVHYFKSIDWKGFATLTIWGYFKKMVIADNLNDLVTPVFQHVDNYAGSTLLLTGFFFVVQVYCDFSGYSDIATGVAKLFGIQLSLNWRRPLLSSSLHEFWTRNHISITTWFRDYLYISLGGNRVSYGRWLLNIFLVFVISGIWHGANFTFLVWGCMHGLVYIVELLLRKRFPQVKIPYLLGWVYLLCFHTFSLIAFRALNLHDLWQIYGHIFHQFHPGAVWQELSTIKSSFFLCFCGVLILFLFLKEIQEEHQLLRLPAFDRVWRPLFYLVLLSGIFLLGNFNANQFIYFQF